MSQERIIKMFDSISKRYDLVNRVLTFGIDKKWRKDAIKEAKNFLNKKDLVILDVACGTGDMIEIWEKEVKANIIGLDASKGMLEVAKKRFKDKKFIHSLATNIPLEEESVDAISISFGIRNILDIEDAIKEFYRVLKTKGIVVVLEFTKDNNPTKLRQCVDFYSNKLLPKIGGILSRNKEAYEYLPKSIENFYTPKELASLFGKNNFSIMHLDSFNLGQVTLLIAQKI